MKQVREKAVTKVQMEGWMEGRMGQETDLVTKDLSIKQRPKIVE